MSCTRIIRWFSRIETPMPLTYPQGGGLPDSPESTANPSSTSTPTEAGWNRFGSMPSTAVVSSRRILREKSMPIMLSLLTIWFPTRLIQRIIINLCRHGSLHLRITSPQHRPLLKQAPLINQSPPLLNQNLSKRIREDTLGNCWPVRVHVYMITLPSRSQYCTHTRTYSSIWWCSAFLFRTPPVMYVAERNLKKGKTWRKLTYLLFKVYHERLRFCRYEESWN